MDSSVVASFMATPHSTYRASGATPAVAARSPSRTVRRPPRRGPWTPRPGVADPSSGGVASAAVLALPPPLGPAVTLRASVLAALLGLGLPGGCADPGPGFELLEGWRGYPCYFDEECLAPLHCNETPAAPTPVCTGTALEGEVCGEGVACAWLRDELGLPLWCGEDGHCAFPEVEPPTTGAEAP